MTEGDASETARLKAEARLQRAEMQRADAAKVRAEIEAATEAQAAKTVRLRSLRLAKEAADREAQASVTQAPPRKRK